MAAAWSSSSGRERCGVLGAMGGMGGALHGGRGACRRSRAPEPSLNELTAALTMLSGGRQGMGALDES